MVEILNVESEDEKGEEGGAGEIKGGNEGEIENDDTTVSSNSKQFKLQTDWKSSNCSSSSKDSNSSESSSNISSSSSSSSSSGNSSSRSDDDGSTGTSHTTLELKESIV